MSSVLYVDCDEPRSVEDDTVRVSLEFDTDDAGTFRCRACGDVLIETASGCESESGERLCPDYVPTDDDAPDVEGGPHDPERLPLSWINSAAIDADELGDSVTVSISVGDPRGAFTFQIRRIPDDVDGDLAGRLVLHMPHPGETSPHRELTQLHAGTCVIA